MLKNYGCTSDSTSKDPGNFEERKQMLGSAIRELLLFSQGQWTHLCHLMLHDPERGDSMALFGTQLESFHSELDNHRSQPLQFSFEGLRMDNAVIQVKEAHLPWTDIQPTHVPGTLHRPQGMMVN